MRTNNKTQKMSTGSGQREELGQLTSAREDEYFPYERDGCRCQACGVIGGLHGLEDVEMLMYPPHPDTPRDEQIPVCTDCFVDCTNEQLDEHVAEMQEHQRALEKDRGDYEKNRERTFERDDHTCQLCGQEGYPKTERGLVAYPVRAGDYHLNNLVTVCNDCITDTLDSDEDDQIAADRLRLQAARAKEWITSDEADTEQPDDIKGRR
jgi:hypothetical protein